MSDMEALRVEVAELVSPLTRRRKAEGYPLGYARAIDDVLAAIDRLEAQWPDEFQRACRCVTFAGRCLCVCHGNAGLPA